jgi:hypothetical protein
MIDREMVQRKLKLLLTRMEPKLGYTAVWRGTNVVIYMGDVRAWIDKCMQPEYGPGYLVFIMKCSNQVWDKVNIGQHI